MAGRTSETDLAKRIIPVAKPFFDRKETEAACDVIKTGWVSQGPKVKEFEEAFCAYVGSQYACAVTNCTAALHTAIHTVGVRPGNIVITVSHSFIATANCIRYCCAEPVFVDVDLETYNMSVDRLSECLQNECETRNGQLYYKNITELVTENSPLNRLKPDEEFGKVAAILVVHQLGMPADLRAIVPLARKFQIPLIEDAACAAGSELLMEELGHWEKIGKPHGDIACFSFHPRKVLVTGEGGMLTTNNGDYDRQFRLLRHQGMSVSDRDRHTATKIIQEEYPVIGFNYRMSDILAAIGLEQLNKLPSMIAKRRELAGLYRKELGSIPWLAFVEELPYVRTNWQSFAIRLLEGAPLDQISLMQYLLDHGVTTRPGVMNAHEQKHYVKTQRSLNNSESAKQSVVVLPLYDAMNEDEVYQIVELIKNAR